MNIWKEYSARFVKNVMDNALNNRGHVIVVHEPIWLNKSLTQIKTGWRAK